MGRQGLGPDERLSAQAEGKVMLSLCFLMILFLIAVARVIYIVINRESVWLKLESVKLVAKLRVLFNPFFLSFFEMLFIVS